MNDTVISPESYDYVIDVLDSGKDYYRAYEELATFVSDADQKSWFEQAAIINKKANGIEPDPSNNQSSTFILGYIEVVPVFRTVLQLR